MIDRLLPMLNWWRGPVPVGECPDLLDVPQPAPPESAAAVIDRHFAVLQNDLPRKPTSAYVCGCGQLFDYRIDWGRNVAELIT